MATRKRKKRHTPEKPSQSGQVGVVEHDGAPPAFPVVGIGASAGGIEAFTSLLRALPEDPGAAFVLIQHQEPTHESMLVHIISRVTKMEVQSISSDVRIEPNKVYVAPAEGQVVLEDGVLRLVSSVTHSMPVDNFFRSLAEDLGSRAIGVVLSGTASDGSAGTMVIKAEGGITFAQDDSAKFESMPRNAVATGAIDFILSPKDIARELVRIGRSAAGPPEKTAALSASDMEQVFAILRRRQDVDFSHYKPATIERRIRRRMALRKVGALTDYLTILQEDRGEVEQLFGDLLIRVTGFFRDPEVFETLKRDIFPRLIADRQGNTPVRIWVPGCATGEEVYSLAISLLELTSEGAYSCPVQIFGTDISESAVNHARAGVYPAAHVSDVSPVRLGRFFAKTNGSYRVVTAVRDCCIFARQNLTKDPPFSRLDLISCRNVLIYLGAGLQRRVMSIFHYALRPHGYLLLGGSETIATYSDLFAVADRKQRIYQRKASTNRTPFVFDTTYQPRENHQRERTHDDATTPDVFREADRAILTRYASTGVLISENMDIVQFRGRTSAYLEPAPGTASMNLLKMAKEGLLPELRAAIHKARRGETSVKREGIRMKGNGGTILVNVEVIPFSTPASERYQLVLFETADVPPKEDETTGGKRRKGKGVDAESRQSQRLKRELEATREYLQAIIEDQEAMNEELRSANEEIQSSNEELQSTNEEMETAKEELQSSNEELVTLNEELQNRNEELGEVHNDLVNILTSVDFPIVMLDSELRIRRFNPGAERALNLKPSDVGRPVADIKTALAVEDLDRVIGSVIGNLDMRELEAQDRGGKTYSLRIRPYKTMDNRIEGAVLVLTEKEGRTRKASDAS